MRFYHASNKKAPSVVVAPDGVHSRQKKAILRAFSESALQAHERLLRPFVDISVGRLGQISVKKQHEFVDLTEWYNHVMFDFMSLELFGESLGCLENETNHAWVDILFSSIKAWAVLSQANKVPAKRESEFESDPSTFSAYMRASKDPKSTLSPEEVLSNHSFMMMAGSETTATLLSGCTFFLLKHPTVYEKWSCQIRERFPSASDISFSSLAGMEFLRAVIKETLRMYPPLPLGMPRVVPNGGSIVLGRFVPEKTSVAVASWATYHSSSNFVEPNTFAPERWLDDSKVDGNHDIDCAMQAFSVGPRACPGKNLAFAEASLILALLLWNFELKLSPDCSNWADQRAFVIWDRKPLLVKLTPRS
ncbi:cytochrome P450 monooxygenase [Penicillium verhagenii]|uniref:cytochrome P450 monooxygenase n=1 Tax=Penicillium verhagenii TaxID=1562060 RepID=UPI0025457D2C|nr:cytochrome P450 monooxygenase [Penicillium verhagenii]KAJ5921061.1 cytochrome P450 monooxygenase [Penicillium verhagenii]